MLSFRSVPFEEYMRMKLTTLGAISAALAVSAVAGAQDNVKPIGLSLRAGVFLPTNSGTADVAGTGFFAFGAEYLLTYKPPTFLINGATSGLSVSVDYYRRDDYGNIPILANYILAKNRFAFSAGVGVGFTTLPSGSDSDVKFAYQVGVEYDLPTTGSLPIFLSAKYFGSENNRLNGVGLYAGIKF